MDIKYVQRSEFIGSFVGLSYMKTIDLLNQNIGKILVFTDQLVIDSSDSFAIEAETAIDAFLLQHPNEINVHYYRPNSIR